MQDGFFFGYGSLVNRRTHGFDQAHPARVQGWRRAWRATALRQVAYLTVLPDAACSIDGLIAAVPGQDWAALDAREAAYARVTVSDAVVHGLDWQPEIVIYAIPDGAHAAPDADSPILQSYLDVVMQGFLHQFGAEGLARFLATTDGWQAPILQDRADPVYPRHQTLDPAERRLFDGLLDDHGVRRMAMLPGARRISARA